MGLVNLFKNVFSYFFDVKCPNCKNRNYDSCYVNGVPLIRYFSENSSFLPIEIEEDISNGFNLLELRCLDCEKKWYL